MELRVHLLCKPPLLSLLHVCVSLRFVITCSIFIEVKANFAAFHYHLYKKNPTVVIQPIPFFISCSFLKNTPKPRESDAFYASGRRKPLQFV